jgi:alkylation response protein AidB-like acyl-CoA dehydrogenase
MIDLPFFERHHAELDARVEAFAAAEIGPRAEAAESGDVNDAARSFIASLAKASILRLLVPRAHGGEFDEPDLRAICVTREHLASASGVADSVFAVDGLGAYPISIAGSEALRRRYLPRVAEGTAIGAFAVTEPGAGSDLRGIQTRAVRDGDAYVVDGVKTFISNAGIADFYVLFARTSDDDRRGLSAFVVDAGSAIAVSPMALLAPHPIGEVTFTRCRVPEANRLGAEGDGLKIAHATLDFFRASVGAAACGFAARALSEATAHVRRRQQFGAALAEFQATKIALADMATGLDAARLLVYRAAWMKDRGDARIPRESSMAKLFATEAAQRIVDRALQLHGGAGVVRGVVVERLYREVRALRIYEGTSEIQRLVIANDVLG